MNPLLELRKQGQSIWLDYIRRDLLRNGELKDLIANDGLRGVTSNPSIFEKAIDGSSQYDEALRVLFARDPGIEAREIYDELSIEDVRNAADILQPAYRESGGQDGFVSIEPPPQLRSEIPVSKHARSTTNSPLKMSGMRRISCSPPTARVEGRTGL